MKNFNYFYFDVTWQFFMYYQILCFSFLPNLLISQKWRIFSGKKVRIFFSEYIFLQNSQNTIYWPTIWISEILTISKHQILKIKIKVKSIVKCKLVMSTINKTYYKLFSLSEHFQVPGTTIFFLSIYIYTRMQDPHTSTHGSQGRRGTSSQSGIIESSMCGHQLFYISRYI